MLSCRCQSLLGFFSFPVYSNCQFYYYLSLGKKKCEPNLVEKTSMVCGIDFCNIAIISDIFSTEQLHRSEIIIII